MALMSKKSWVAARILTGVWSPHEQEIRMVGANGKRTENILLPIAKGAVDLRG